MFQRYLRSKSKVNLNRGEFWTYFAFPILRRRGPSNLYRRYQYHSCLAAYHVVKFREVTPLSSKVMVAYTLHFKPILTPSLQKIVGEAAVPGLVCTSKPWSFYSACKNFGAQHSLGAIVFRKSRFSEYVIMFAPLNLRG